MNFSMRASVVLAITYLCAGGMYAQESKPIQLALFNPIQIFPENTSINGLRLSLLYGRNVSVTGLDVGLVNVSTGGTSGGVQFGLLAMNKGSFAGWQWATIALNDGRFEGFQGPWSIYNKAGHVGGIQIGLVNQTGTMNGIQLGLINIIDEGGFMPLFPIVNWSF